MHGKIATHIKIALQHRSSLQTLLFITLIIVITSGCALIPEMESTADAAPIPSPTASNGQPGEVDLLETAHALGTQISDDRMLETAAAFATSRALQPDQQHPTDTLSADTQTPTTPKDIPADIPIPDIPKENFYSTMNFISFTTLENFQYISSYYAQKMPHYDWTKVEAGSYETENAIQMNFEKSERKAIVAIQENPLSRHVTVTITIKNR